MCVRIWPYRSPISRLVRFFRPSRDNWKAKYNAAKRENKSLKTRLAKMTESRNRWKAQAGCLRDDLQTEKAPVEQEAPADPAPTEKLPSETGGPEFKAPLPSDSMPRPRPQPGGNNPFGERPPAPRPRPPAAAPHR